MLLEGLSEELMSDLACQFMDVMQIPKELDNILRAKSHGVASWCEQLIKDMLVRNIIQIVLERQAFAKSSEHMSLALPENSNNTISRVRTPFYNAESVVFEDDEVIGTNRRRSLPVTSKGKSGGAFGKIRPDSTERSRRDRRMSTGTTKDLRFNLEDSCEGSDALGDFALNPKSSAIDREFQSARKLSLSNDSGESAKELKVFHLDRSNFVHAAEGTMPVDTGNMCIVTPDVDISKFLVPDSVKDMVLARVDRMLPVEQVSLKCASILGTNFHRDLLEYLLPTASRKNLGLVLYNLAKEGILECASLAVQHQLAHNHHGFYDYNDPIHAHHHTHHHHHHHHHNVATMLHAPVLCGCHADEVTKVVNLTRLMTPTGPKKHCMCLKFTNTYMQETAYALWLEDQRRALHERAAMFLESQAHKCRSCGGGGFVSGQGHGNEARSGGNTKSQKRISGKERAYGSQ